MGPVRPNKVKDLTDMYLETQLEDLPSEEEIASQQVLSKRFLRRMDHLIRIKHRPIHTWKKMLLVAAIICAILATTVSVYAYREVIVSFIIHVYEEFTLIVFQQPPETTGPSFETNTNIDILDNLPSVPPQGYKFFDQLKLKGFIQIIYTNENGQKLLFIKQDKSGLQFGIDTEGVTIEEMDINGYKGIFYANKGQNNLVWEDDYYAYAITGEIDKQEMIVLAISTK